MNYYKASMMTETPNGLQVTEFSMWESGGWFSKRLMGLMMGAMITKMMKMFVK